MIAKQIGFLGFDGVIASHLTGPADAFALASLSDGFGNRIPCYEVFTVSLTSEPFRAESGMSFIAQKNLRNAPAARHHRHSGRQRPATAGDECSDRRLDFETRTAHTQDCLHLLWHLRARTYWIIGWTRSDNTLALCQRHRAAISKATRRSQKALY